ncbi:MAG: hypothetical protein H6Q73_3079 [Firmicutes bacterium]|nr:hypothetical protein [Bacillota bacterium]
MEKSVVIKNPTGLHARPAALLVQKASSFRCNVSLVKQGKKANAKSIMNVMALGVGQNDEVLVVTEGEQEAEALQAIVELLEGLKD